MRALAPITITLTTAALLACGGSTETPAPQTPTPEETQTAPASAATESTDLVGIDWVVESIAGEPAAEGVQSTIRFDADGRVSGNSGCNAYQGSYQLEGDRLTFSPLAGTRMFCEGPQQVQEDRYLAAIGTVERVEIADDVLMLYPAEGGEPTRFKPLAASSE